jgi:hypothetical protein
MPYAVVPASKTHNLYYVVTKATGKKHSNHPLTKEMAERQFRALMMYAPR